MQDLWQRIKQGAQAIGDFQARLILSLLYMVLVLPTGLLLKLGGNVLDPVSGRRHTTYWAARTVDKPELRNARRQG
jgi:hypothetical protein